MTIREYRVGETMSDEDSLAHYGVKGMKWGQRLAGSKFGRAAQKNAANAQKRTAVGVAVGRTVGGGAIAERIKNRRTAPDISGVSRRDAKTQIRKQNKESDRRLEDFERSPNRSNQIRSARAKALTAQRNYEDVRADIKAQKGSGALGKNAAKVLLNKASNEHYETMLKADSLTTGEQMVEAFFSGLTPRRT